MARFLWLIAFLLGCSEASIAPVDAPVALPDLAPSPPDAPPLGPCGSCSAPNKCCEIESSQYCLVVQSDLLNCGDCGHACEDGKTNACAGGLCKCGFGPACGESDTCCPAGCRNLKDDEQNCGACGTSCSLGATCVAGQCLCGEKTCAMGEACCGDACVDVRTDPVNCGTCGHACTDMTSSCNAGVCGCPSGGGACPSGAGTVPSCCPGGCFDLCNDIDNCGACGHSCLAADGFDLCLSGGCFVAGDPPLDVCSGGFPPP